MPCRLLIALWLAMGGMSVAWAAQPPTPLGLLQAATDRSAACEAAVTTAESAARLPARLLQAISLTESGRTNPLTGRLQAWPWTINAEGQGQFFATRQDAIAAASALRARGIRSIDVGCMQVNLLYHPDAFVSLDEAFDPMANARYAARFLAALYAEAKDWPHAIGLYHSETPALGGPYRVLVMARWRNGEVTAHTPEVGSTQYRDFAPTRDDRVYSAFAPRSRVYGAFVPH